MDDVDRMLLSLLQANAKASNAELAEAVGLTVSSVFERVKKLELRGVITGYTAKVDPGKLGKELLAFVRLTLADAGNTREGLERLRNLCTREPDILECHDVAGEDCIILKVRSRGTTELQKILNAIKDAIPVSRSVTSIVLETLKEGSAIQPGPDKGDLG